ncbi:MAG: arginine deiminase-related protein [Gemmatimonadaceae bacterium]
MPLIAITRAVSPSLAECELTHLARERIDVERASRQHLGYEAALRDLGVVVIRAEPAPDSPDAVFVEDTAIVLPELAVLTRPGAASRRSEVAAIGDVLAPYRNIVEMQAPATLDGGDVVRLGRTLYVGSSSRTNEAGIDALASFVEPHGYSVVAVSFSGCLHLKSAATAIGDSAVLINPSWVSVHAFGDAEVIEVDRSEPFAANALRIGQRLIHGAEYVATRERLEEWGADIVPVDCSELAKAEGAVTCCCLLVT